MKRRRRPRATRARFLNGCYKDYHSYFDVWFRFFDDPHTQAGLDDGLSWLPESLAARALVKGGKTDSEETRRVDTFPEPCHGYPALPCWRRRLVAAFSTGSSGNCAEVWEIKIPALSLQRARGQWLGTRFIESRGFCGPPPSSATRALSSRSRSGTGRNRRVSQEPNKSLRR